MHFSPVKTVLYYLVIANSLVLDLNINCIYLIHTMEYYSAIKKNEIMPLAATWMDLEIIILSEVSQTEKDKYCIFLLRCGN